MRRLSIIPVSTAAFLFALTAGSGPSLAGDVQLLLASAVPNASQATGQVMNFGAEQRLALNACGLCSDVDCCGGSENGWKLCASDCPSGQYRCEQVAVCK